MVSVSSIKVHNYLNLTCVGLVASHAVFLAYMVVLRKSALAGLAAFLIVCTILAKLM